jgi:hypothetical protein
MLMHRTREFRGCLLESAHHHENAVTKISPTSASAGSVQQNNGISDTPKTGSDSQDDSRPRVGAANIETSPVDLFDLPPWTDRKLVRERELMDTVQDAGMDLFNEVCLGGSHEGAVPAGLLLHDTMLELMAEKGNLPAEKARNLEETAKFQDDLLDTASNELADELTAELGSATNPAKLERLAARAVQAADKAFVSASLLQADAIGRDDVIDEGRAGRFQQFAQDVRQSAQQIQRLLQPNL